MGTPENLIRTFHHPIRFMRSLPRLPVELTDRIIDFCHDDKRTLSNCALTHSLWLPASHFHLFHTITFGTREEEVTLLRSIIYRRPLTLSHRQPSILSYINVVKIEPLSSPNRPSRIGNAQHLAQDVRQFCKIKNLPIPSVHVKLSQFHPCPGSYITWSLFFRIEDIVTQLQLLNVTIRHRKDIRPFLSSFPQLQHLEISNPTFESHLAGPAQGFYPHAERTFDDVPLSTLQIGTTSMEYFISTFLAEAGFLSHITDFGISYQDTGQGQLLELVGAIRKRVKRLRFSAGCYPGEKRDRESRPSASDPSQQIVPPRAIGNLMTRFFSAGIPELVRKFRSLDTLVLGDLRVDGSSSTYHTERYDISFEWITGVLQQLSSPIRKLVFEVTATDYRQLNAIPWEFIDGVVYPEDPQFRDLARVEVLVEHGVRREGSPPSILKDTVCSEITRRLPRLHRLDLLRCHTIGC